MVCSVGSGRMAVMARLLSAGSMSQTIVEDVDRKKLAAQYVYRELRGVDEANLLDEEDMHVFDLKPMMDPLNLVCCNACKKPVKASQFAAHAELCKSLSSVEDILLELDGGTRPKKPPRKERKKLLTTYANQVTGVVEKERFETENGHDTAASDSHLNERMQLTSSFHKEAKGNSMCVDRILILDGSGISPGNTDYSGHAMPPPTKRSKLIADEGLSDHLETESVVTKSLCTSTQEAFTCREYLNESSAGSRKSCDNAAGYQIPWRIHDCYFPTKEFPAPLATKIFYSQRNHRVRSVISHLYYKTSTNEHGSGIVNRDVLQGNTLVSRTSSSKKLSREQFDEQQEKRKTHLVPSVQSPSQVHAQSSIVYLDSSEECHSAMNFSDQFPMNNVLEAHRAPAGMLRTNYPSNLYSFADNSEKPLGTMQQRKGSVPVV